VADIHNHVIRKITGSGEVSTVAGAYGQAGYADGTGSNARFNYPQGVAVDRLGNVYVADHSNQSIRKIAAGGEVSTLGGASGQSYYADGNGSDARFNYPQGVAVDGSGNVYIADTRNSVIRKGASDSSASLVSSSLGAPTDPANATIDLGSLSSSAALVYSGSGETTSRPLNLAGTTGGAGSLSPHAVHDMLCTLPVHARHAGEAMDEALVATIAAVLAG
jgi:hypothetical protein